MGFPFEAAKGVVIIVMIGATELITYGLPADAGIARQFGPDGQTAAPAPTSSTGRSTRVSHGHPV